VSWTQSIQVNDVLGHGSFCCAFLAQLETDGGAPEQVVLKCPRLGSLMAAEDHRDLMAREATVLKLFADHAHILPTLHSAPWSVNLSAPYLCLADVGVPLPSFAQGQPKKERVASQAQLHNHLTAGLLAAHGLGWYHADLRPDNVIRVNDTFKIIDWGLAVPAGGTMHTKRGGLAFFADALVMGRDGPPIVYEPQYDLEVVTYVCCAYVVGLIGLQAPWISAGNAIVPARAKLTTQPVEKW
jgi:serine/threonine protein kinase